MLRQAAAEVLARLTDAVDATLTTSARGAVQSTPGVDEVRDLRLRWVGHELRVECVLTTDPTMTVEQTGRLCDDVRHRFRHSLQHVGRVTIQLEPAVTSSSLRADAARGRA